MHRNHSALATLALALALSLLFALPAVAETPQPEEVAPPTSEVQVPAVNTQTTADAACDSEELDLASLFAEQEVTEMMGGCGCFVNSDCDGKCLDGGSCVNGQCQCNFGSCQGGTGPGSGPGSGPGCGGPVCSRFSDCYSYCGGNTGGLCHSGCCLC